MSCKFSICLFGMLFYAIVGIGQQQTTSFSTAGYYPVKQAGFRQAFNFDNDWYFHKGDIKNALTSTVNSEEWALVQLPHSVDVLPEEASGGKNYQGIVWYKKYFQIPKSISDKNLSLHFEGILGKCEIWINGKHMITHAGSYLPVVISLTNNVLFNDKENVIVVKTDNSDDKTYPPGKAQYVLDFTYFGGIYRDVWLTAENDLRISDPMTAGKVAGGGVFVHYENVSDGSATVCVKTHIISSKKNNAEKGSLITSLKNGEGKTVATASAKFVLKTDSGVVLEQKFVLKKPLLWSPQQPNRYELISQVKNSAKKTTDGFKQKIGVRSIEFKGKEGFFLNGKPYAGKLIGANHHQDYAYIGSAMPNNLQWRDVKKLKDAAVDIIRLAHYPHDPAFMDACDELGVFVIVPTPGWQYWTSDSAFGAQVLMNNRNMVRRDRNHPSVIAWEPILNETRYPEEFAKEAYNSVHSEYPYPGCVAAEDINTPYWKNFDLIYAHPNAENAALTSKSIFTREWGDNVDDWNAHNSTSRAARKWGEIPQLVQAVHYDNPPYAFDSWKSLYETPKQHVGGALWHSFDHQRGYHPDPFYGGIMDAFRQPKYAYYLFKSQTNGNRSDTVAHPYFVFVANEMSPFSPSDVTVYSNCDEIRLIKMNGDTLIQKADHEKYAMPHPSYLFKNVYTFMQMKELDRGGKSKQMKLVAEGYVNGQKVATTTKIPTGRPSKIWLSYDMEGIKPQADGSSIIPVFAAVCDKKGSVKRLNNERVLFQVSGEGEIIGDQNNNANPYDLEWGTAPLLVRTSTKPGLVTIIAKTFISGTQTPQPDTLKIVTVPAGLPVVNGTLKFVNKAKKYMPQENSSQPDQKNIQKKMKEVERDQSDFENKTKNK